MRLRADLSCKCTRLRLQSWPEAGLENIAAKSWEQIQSDINKPAQPTNPSGSNSLSSGPQGGSSYSYGAGMGYGAGMDPSGSNSLSSGPQGVISPSGSNYHKIHRGISVSETHYSEIHGRISLGGGMGNTMGK
ncbi:hypothetical protein XENTR_v10015783 [Xenopus tropicalis]|nr:hypothetical protein XENTR_v10015783 [Xenopus tropicalis]